MDTVTIDALSLIALIIGASSLMLLAGAGIGYYSAAKAGRLDKDLDPREASLIKEDV